MPFFARSLSTRLYVQAALTGLLAPVSAHGSMWLAVTFAVAVGAVVVGSILRNDESRARELVVGFEALALAVGVVGLAGHHYIPGTIIGIVTLIAVLNNNGSNAPRVYLPAHAAVPYPRGGATAPEPTSESVAPVAFVPVPAVAEILPKR